MPLRDFTPQEKMLSERRRTELPLFVTVWLGTAAFSVTDGSWFYLLAVTLAVGVNLWAVRRALEAHVRRLFINLAVVASVGIMVVELSGRHAGVLQAIGHFLILLQVCKLFEQKTNRDYTQLLTLSGLLMLAGALLSNSLWFTALLAMHLTVLCYSAAVFTLKRGLDAAARRLPGEANPPEVRQLAWNVGRDWPARPVHALLALALGVALTSGVAAFLLLPRSGAAASPFFAGQRDATTGFDPKVRLGDTTGQVYQSNEVLMHVALRGPRAVSGSGQEAYLRGATFNAYTYSRWENIETIDFSRESVLPTLPPSLHDELIVQDVSMVPSLQPNLFAIYPAVAVRPEDGWVYYLPDLTVELGRRREGDRRIRYKAYTLSRPLSQRAQDYLASLRTGFGVDQATPPRLTVAASPAVRELAREWCADLLARRDQMPRGEGDLLIARRIAARLAQQCTYTLDLSDVEPDRDGVEDFLFHTRRGHCEYFASAMTVLCRTLDVRARLVTGFLMDEYDRNGGHFVVRGRDAHAWTEVFTPETDWLVVDATPPGGRRVHGQVWLGSLRRFINNLEFAWYERVISYDENSRRRLTDWLREQAEVLKWAAVTAGRAFKESFLGLLLEGHVDRLLAYAVLTLGALAAVLEGLLIARVAHRRVRKRRTTLGRLPLPPTEMKFMLRLLTLLERHGVRRSDDRTPRELAAQARRSLDLPAGVLDELIDLYYRTRWGFVPPAPAELHRAERQVAQLAKVLAQRGG